LKELKRQVQLHPSILPADFDITPSGELVLNLPPAPEGYQVKFKKKFLALVDALLKSYQTRLLQIFNSLRHIFKKATNFTLPVAFLNTTFQ
jgi:hypothetical protein